VAVLVTVSVSTQLSIKMRIVVHDYCGHPFQVQLARELARRGHQVRHLSSSAVQTPRGALERRADDPAGFSVLALDPGEALPKYSYVRRFRHERRYSALLAQALQAFQPDRVLFSNTPPDALDAAARWCRTNSRPYLLWLQDIVTEAIARIVGAKLGPAAWPVIWRYRQMEGRLLRQAARVVAITDDFRSHLEEWGVPAERIAVVENWAPLEELPQRPRDNAFAREQGLMGKTVFLYAGTLGLKHNPALLSALAERLRPRADVRVVVVSEGLGADFLLSEKHAKSLDNLLLLPFQPFARLPDTLASADVVVAILEPEAGIFSVPSKVLTYHCARRPILGAMPAENLAARLIERERSGIVVDPRDLPAFLSAAQRFLDDSAGREQMAIRARNYAERAFDIGVIGARFEELLEVADPPDRKPSRTYDYSSLTLERVNHVHE
jgi:colanic acid biosynthesis glycosyl transferase WcaI